MPRGHKGEPKTPGSGRKKGEPNKLTRTVKDVVSAVFNELQEMKAGKPVYPGAHMQYWALEQPTEFYKIAAKLIPTEIAGKAELTLQIVKFGDDPAPE